MVLPTVPTIFVFRYCNTAKRRPLFCLFQLDAPFRSHSQNNLNIDIYVNIWYYANMIDREPIDNSIREIRILIERLEKYSDQAPAGSLKIRVYPSGKKAAYVSTGSKKNRVITRIDPEDRQLLMQMERKAFARKALPELRQALKALERAHGYEPVNLYGIAAGMGPEFRTCADFFLGRAPRQPNPAFDGLQGRQQNPALDGLQGRQPNQAFDSLQGRLPNPAFDSLKERQNPYEFDSSAIRTELGLFRSKGESLDAEIMTNLGVEFKYEVTLQVGAKWINVDFVVNLYWKQQIGIIEHHGLLDDPKYRRKKLADLTTMMNHGIYPGQNLLILSESEEYGFDVALARRLIAAFCLPPGA